MLMINDHNSVAVLLTADLMLESQAEAAARDAGVRLIAVSQTKDAIESATSGNAHCLAVDLSTPGAEIQQIRDAIDPLGPVRLIAFGPHVHQRRLESARAAGFDAVLTRGQFHSQLREQLAASSSQG